ncbi:MAG: phosphate ABC transporter permease PstA [Agitococcus sp.]|nr:phosphate ABC transporter permease PstA [Moraxellaceae bacterium]MBL0231752.1 phosphate ABC transporter permease PstA [Moraxellaceae bacterium]MBP9216337.1 phosphate ABC transporter permease PstA [Agitococcus sp.]MCC6375248.1 phosphate ABC transporter permease PstA [Moraxellaceae bacterium]HQV80472.1 phosphate ABC transporter permease PstA [Agitococcus sp.]
MKLREYFKSGEAWVWLNAGAVAISLIMVVGILGLVAVRGLGHFWPADVLQAQYNYQGQSTTIIGEIYDEKVDTAKRLRESGVDIPASVDTVTRYSIKQGNKDITGQDFRWVLASHLQNQQYPADIVALERYEWGAFYGRLKSLKENGQLIAEGDKAWTELQTRLARSNGFHQDIKSLEKGEVGAINFKLEKLRLQERKLELKGELDDTARAELAAKRDEQHQKYEVLKTKLEQLRHDMERDSAVFVVADGTEKEIPLSKIVAAHKPNAMGVLAKLGAYGQNAWSFLSDDPREANTEGGVFPAIFGTVLMVLMMTVIVTPLGVIAAIYLREYATQGVITQTVRIAVNNLAGVPSIVYGVFGLGFFIYFLGGNIDRLFYPESSPAPVFGTPGLLWSAITLALMTLPVLIVSTEEGLSRIPRALKEGSLALGATKAETLWRVVLPMAMPSIMTGVILAIARAAGEVAPLMLVGVVKLAPTLPVDLNAPFIHLERKFMHLGFHIYDVGFQSPNVEAARPLVYATAFLLVFIVAALNLSAVALRNRLREKYKALES